MKDWFQWFIYVKSYWIFLVLVYLCFSEIWTSSPFLVEQLFSQYSQLYWNWLGKCLDSTWFLTWFLPPCLNCKQILHFHLVSPTSLEQKRYRSSGDVMLVFSMQSEIDAIILLRNIIVWLSFQFSYFLKWSPALHHMTGKCIFRFTKLITNRAMISIIVREVLWLQVKPGNGQVSTHFFT